MSGRRPPLTVRMAAQLERLNWAFGVLLGIGLVAAAVEPTITRIADLVSGDGE